MCEEVQLPGAGESINELGAAAGEIQVGAEFVRRFIAAVLKEWQETDKSGSVPSCAAALL